MTLYAVGDVHGRADALDRALALIAADGGPDARIVFLGDYVDRGPDSCGVLDRLARGVADGRPWTCLLGNHDRMFRRFLEHGDLSDGAILSGATWLHPALGGRATLASYGVATPATEALEEDGWSASVYNGFLAFLAEARAAVPASHRAFLDARPLTHAAEGCLFVHAGLRPGVPVEAQFEDDLIWIREPFLSDPRDHGALVVHGHTALPAPRHLGNRVGCDGGAGYGRPLVPVAIEARAAWALTDAGRLAMPPPQ